MWSGPKGASVQERLDRAQEAKKALLERFKQQPGPGDKQYEERQAHLRAVAEARREREELRLKQKAEAEARRAEEAKLKAEREAREAAEAAERAVHEAAEAAERKVREEAEFAALMKAEEDARRMVIVKEQREARKAAKKKKKRGLYARAFVLREVLRAGDSVFEVFRPAAGRVCPAFSIFGAVFSQASASACFSVAVSASASRTLV